MDTNVPLINQLSIVVCDSTMMEDLPAAIAMRVQSNQARSNAGGASPARASRFWRRSLLHSTGASPTVGRIASKNLSTVLRQSAAAAASWGVGTAGSGPRSSVQATVTRANASRTALWQGIEGLDTREPGSAAATIRDAGQKSIRRARPVPSPPPSTAAPLASNSWYRIVDVNVRPSGARVIRSLKTPR